MMNMLMGASPLQMTHITYTRVEIESKFAEQNTWAPEFDFEGVNIQHMGNIMPRETKPNDPVLQYLVTLALRVDDEQPKPIPYTFDIEAYAVFEVRPGDFREDEREKIVLVNGASMIVSAIRELLLQLTSRSFNGALLLPTLQFRPEENKKEHDQL